MVFSKKAGLGLLTAAWTLAGTTACGGGSGGSSNTGSGGGVGVNAGGSAGSSAGAKPAKVDPPFTGHTPSGATGPFWARQLPAKVVLSVGVGDTVVLETADDKVLFVRAATGETITSLTVHNASLQAGTYHDKPAVLVGTPVEGQSAALDSWKVYSPHGELQASLTTTTTAAARLQGAYFKSGSKVVSLDDKEVYNCTKGCGTEPVIAGDSILEWIRLNSTWTLVARDLTADGADRWTGADLPRPDGASPKASPQAVGAVGRFAVLAWTAASGSDEILTLNDAATGHLVETLGAGDRSGMRIRTSKDRKTTVLWGANSAFGVDTATGHKLWQGHGGGDIYLVDNHTAYGWLDYSPLEVALSDGHVTEVPGGPQPAPYEASGDGWLVVVGMKNDQLWGFHTG